MSDFYWINIPETNTFFILPESELLDRGYVAEMKDDINVKMSIYINLKRSSWYDAYKFDYQNDEQRVKSCLML